SEVLAALNRPPVLAPIQDQTVDEGSTLTLPITASDPDAGQTLTFSLDAAPAGASVDSHTGVFTWTPPDRPATATVTVPVIDSGTPALSATGTFSITVNNVAPAVASLAGPAPSPGVRGQTLSFGGSFTDAGLFDTHTATFDWGDGSSSPAVLTEAGGSGTV